MQVKTKYRMTQIGLIPEEWSILKLGDIVDYTKGFAFKSEDYQSDGVRIIRVSDTTADSIKDTNAIYIDSRKAKSYSPWMLKEHDLILSTVGSKPPLYESMVGKVIMITKKNEGTLLNQNAVILRAKDEKPYKQCILLNNFRTKRYLNHIEVIFRGNANQASITLKDLFDFRLAMPQSDSEQRAIAAALSDADALINSLDRLIAKKRDIKQATMQQLLTGKTRLPGFTGEWEVRRLGEIGECIIGLTYRPENVVPYGLLVLRSSNIQNDKLCLDDNVFVNIDVPQKLVIQNGDILICVRNGSRALIGKCVWLDQRSVGNTFGAFMSVYRTPYSRFVSQVFKTHSIQRQIYENIGATINQITNSNLKSFDILLPSIEEQEAICNILDDMDLEVSALEQHRDKTLLLKQGMMQELLTGRTRLV